VKLRGDRLDNKALPNRLHSGRRVTSRTERFIASFHQFLGQSLQRGGVSYAVHPGNGSCSPWALRVAKFLEGVHVKPTKEALDFLVDFLRLRYDEYRLAALANWPD
jgi:hypothetical protein